MLEETQRTALTCGPYEAPQVGRGDWIDCAVAGPVRVGGYTEAPIPWPRRHKSGRPSLIVCGDLVRAIATESEIAIAHWWGVGVVTVWTWRRHLGIGRVTDGTRRLYTEYQPVKLPEDVSARGREAAARPEAIARMAAAKAGVPRPPRTEAHRAALAEAARRRWARRREQGG